jgi:hypothetical protein
LTVSLADEKAPTGDERTTSARDFPEKSFVLEARTPSEVAKKGPFHRGQVRLSDEFCMGLGGNGTAGGVDGEASLGFANGQAGVEGNRWPCRNPPQAGR